MSNRHISTVRRHPDHKDHTPNQPWDCSPKFIEVIDVQKTRKSAVSPPRPVDQKGVAVKFGGRVFRVAGVEFLSLVQSRHVKKLMEEDGVKRTKI